MVYLYNKSHSVIYAFILQVNQKDDTVSTDTILEFHMGPEETKMVRCSQDSLKVKSAVSSSGEHVQCLDDATDSVYCELCED